MRRSEEFAVKMERLEQFMAEHELAGLALSRAENFAWLGCGASNAVVTSSETGMGTLLVRPGGATLLANNIETERLLTEELDGTGITEAETYPWHEPERREEIIGRASAGGRFAADDGSAGLPPLPAEFSRLRYTLTAAEIERYTALGRDCAEAMERAARSVERGMTERDVTGVLGRQLLSRGITPVVLFVGADDRITRWRHCVTKDATVEHCAMLVTCGRRQGLICAITRLVHFGEPGEDLRARHEAVCRVDAAAILATRPGRKVADVFADVQQAYADSGFPDEWKLHHQGGATGYLPREYLATPGSTEIVHPAQAFGWNPSICGTKSEDTILVEDDGTAVLTAPTADWPVVEAECAGATLQRADILVK
ncbi:MAG: M24 family metallopeptidase [Candidatus Brocadiia bacterium]